jgi:hypothetical protein
MRGIISRLRSVLALVLVVFLSVRCARDHTAADTARILETEATISPDEAQRTKMELVVLRDAVSRYRRQYGTFPRQLRDLERLGAETFSYRSFERWSQDAWGREYRLRADGDQVAVISAGPDGTYGTADDLR